MLLSKRGGLNRESLADNQDGRAGRAVAGKLVP